MLAGEFADTSVTVDNLRFYPIRETDLRDLARWPKFTEKSLIWANFPAATSELQRRWLLHQKQNHIVWIMVRDQDGELIGRCSITQPISSNEVMYGIVLRPDMVEKGLGTQITRIVVAYIFEVTDADVVWLESKYNNERALNTWRKVGFQELGYHFRREVSGQYDKYIGFRFPREWADRLPKLEIHR